MSGLRVDLPGDPEGDPEPQWVFAVPPLSKADIIRVAALTLHEFEPAALRRPQPVDVIHLVDHVLPEHDIDVYPAHADELPGQEAHTRPFDEKPTVLLREDQWRFLMRGGGSGLRARATIAHELGHVILHVPVLRRQARRAGGLAALTRVDASRVQTYADPEWQAWCFAAAFLVPPSTLYHLPSQSTAEIASVYGVSEPFARWVLRLFGEALDYYCACTPSALRMKA